MQEKLNPYATLVDGRDALEIIGASPSIVHRSWDQIRRGAAETRPLAPGRWDARQILCHLADTEIVWSFRLRQALAEPHHVIQPMDQTSWAGQYGAYNGEDALVVFIGLRRWNLALIGRAMPAAAGKPITHPERGELTFQLLLETMAGHDLNHISQLETIAAAVAEVR